MLFPVYGLLSPHSAFRTPHYVRPYLAVLSARFRMLLQYRAAAAAGFATQIFWGLIRVMVFEAFYRSTTAPQPMTYEEVVAYVWLGQALFAMIPFNTDTEVRDMIRSGTVAYELVRPVDLYAYWYARAVAQRLAPTLLRSVPLMILAFAFFDMPSPHSPAAAAVWFLATALAFLLSAAMTVLITLSLLWTISGEGAAQLMSAAVFLLSGMIIPLPLFPDWAQPVLDALPFRAIIDAPFRLYAGHIPPDQALGVLTHQALWLLMLVGFGRWLLGRGTRRLVVQGG
jgi:ABC-2 type transport system permease protein